MQSGKNNFKPFTFLFFLFFKAPTTGASTDGVSTAAPAVATTAVVPGSGATTAPTGPQVIPFGGKPSGGIGGGTGSGSGSGSGSGILNPFNNWNYYDPRYYYGSTTNNNNYNPYNSYYNNYGYYNPQQQLINFLFYGSIFDFF